MTRDALIALYRSTDRECALLDNEIRGVKSFESQWVVPDASERARLRRRMDALRKGIAALAAPEPVFTIMKGHFGDFMDGMELRFADLFAKPGFILGDFAWRISAAEYIDSRPIDELAQSIIRQIDRIPDVWAGISGWLSDVPAEGLVSFMSAMDYNIDCAKYYASRVSETFPGISPADRRELEAALAALPETLNACKNDAQSAMTGIIPESGDGRSLKMTEDEYRGVLSGNLGVDLDELLKWHESEIEKTRGEMLEIASKVPGARGAVADISEVNRLLNTYAGAADTPKEMLVRTEGYLARTRAASRDWVTYPEEECALKYVPYTLKDSFPWGGYCDGDGKRLPPYGVTFLNKWNYRALTDGWMKIQAAHEAYPGHHIQYVRVTTDAIPETMKLGAKYIPLIEGVAHRSERLMEYVFADDPYYPLFVAYRRHHTAVRIKCDLMIRYFGRPAREGMELYMRELGFDENTARGQVLAQEQMPGYFTCYYYGMKRISDWESASQMSKRDFTEMLFSAGNVSLNTLRAFMNLDEGQHASYRKDFKSLLMP